MQKLLLLFIFSFSLFGNNPKVYTQLGDAIYDNVEKIRALKNIDAYKGFEDKIDAYYKKVHEARQFGFEVQHGSKRDLKLEYLENIRKLSKVNEYFFKRVKSGFHSSVKIQNSSLFLGTVNSGLLDTQKNKNKIMKYYNKHKGSINPEGVIQGFLDEAYAKKHKKRYKRKIKTKKQLQEEKMQRLRENDKIKAEALEKKLTTELRAKKQKIRQDQERELFH
ncbi:MAG: hypothetical protein JKY28_06205 [Sulfurimonas sp.]|nr:hypothetical protein [Sulfurimonas sp.]